MRATTLDTLDFGRGPCDREDDCRDDLCWTTLFSIMSKSSITVSLKSKRMLQLTRDFVDSWRLIYTREIIEVRDTISLPWPPSQIFRLYLRNARRSKIAG